MSIACEVCGEQELKTVVDLGKHPLCDDLVPVGSPLTSAEYPIEIAFCPNCKTAHQTHQVPKRTLFPDSYHYRARHTADVINGMRQLVASCEQYRGSLDAALVLDVGCNDGSLLGIFREKGAKTVGVEPTGAAADASASGHSVYRDYFTPALAKNIVDEHGQPDIVTFTNVFAHIEDLPSLLDGLKLLMSDTTVVVVENHYLGAVLDRHQFDTFYHEHPRTYSLASFQYIARTLGAQIASIEFPARYGGNIRVMLQKNHAGLRVSPEVAQVAATEESYEQRLLDMGKHIPSWVQAKRREIDDLVARHGPLYGKAFPGRAAILVKMLGLDEQHVSAVYEKPGSMKIGHYLPGTRIPILSDDEFPDRSNKQTPVVNFAWHISQEIHGYLTRNGCEAPIIDIFSMEEFDRASGKRLE
ncbi:class I SAM-dependent methyltransferase [Hydrogenophaga sp. BPS33]|uniref:class I SAM-dependent methyltransferase n=1 Tax=Hydrogenophaga sp. BPS33 TaxID=2651974 RepID=UPI00131FF9A0|nr:class I SAM-dependent methyltransferase [Hydrogenophaga sp. BPS33]QHE83738.1 class I SAM-dependent methyltransferase [Hydrogenophaga sp. BPS33]